MFNYHSLLWIKKWGGKCFSVLKFHKVKLVLLSYGCSAWAIVSVYLPPSAMPWCVSTVSAPTVLASPTYHHLCVFSQSRYVLNVLSSIFLFFFIQFTQSKFSVHEAYHMIPLMLLYYDLHNSSQLNYLLYTLYSIKIKCYGISDPIAHLLNSIKSSFFLCCSALAKNFFPYILSLPD